MSPREIAVFEKYTILCKEFGVGLTTAPRRNLTYSLAGEILRFSLPRNVQRSLNALMGCVGKLFIWRISTERRVRMRSRLVRREAAIATLASTSDRIRCVPARVVSPPADRLREGVVGRPPSAGHPPTVRLAGGLI